MINKINTPENETSYAKLLKKLDDGAFAYDFKLKKLDRAKFLIGDILAVTLGWSVVTEKGNEWGQKSFLELFEIITIRHKNFYAPDFIEELKLYLFSYSMKHGKEYSKWRKKALASRGLDIYGIEIEKPDANKETSDLPKAVKNESTADEVNGAKRLFPDDGEAFYKPLADRITLILESEDVPQGIKDTLYDLVDTAINESGVNADNDIYVQKIFPRAMAKLENGYSRGLFHSITSVIEKSIDKEIYDPIKEQTNSGVFY